MRLKIQESGDIAVEVLKGLLVEISSWAWIIEAAIATVIAGGCLIIDHIYHAIMVRKMKEDENEEI